MNDPDLIRACRGLRTDKVPVWLMRQAGRYMPAYQAVRARYDFLAMCHTPELAAEITLQPVREFGLDAAIVFSDILLPFESMGLTVQFIEGKGPQVYPEVRAGRDVRDLADARFEPETCFLAETLRIVRGELGAEKALIGFSGAPWTMACYAVEGMGSRDYAVIKRMMNSEPAVLHALLDKITGVLISWLQMQLDAGADAFQVFDSWAEVLAPMDYREFALPYLARIFDALKSRKEPAILYSRDGGAFLEENGRLPIDVLSVDWRVELGALRQRGAGKGPSAYQGNLDPAVLLGNPEILCQKAGRILSENAHIPGYVFNLGHGVLPNTPVENVRTLVNFVQGFKPES